MLSERSPTHKKKKHAILFYLYEIVQNRKICGDRKWIKWLPRAGGVGSRTAVGIRFLLGVMEVM